MPGAAARLGSRLATTTAVAFDTSPHRRKVVTGAPLRRAIVDVDVARDRAAARDELGIPADRFLLLVFGGSLGSGKLNEVVGEFAALSADRPRSRRPPRRRAPPRRAARDRRASWDEPSAGDRRAP